MTSLKRALIILLKQYRLQTGDMDLCRAQFREFVHQVPLMYFIVCWNAVAVAFTYRNETSPWLSLVFPVVLCAVGCARGFWWTRNAQTPFSDAEILRHIRTTGILAIVLTSAFSVWTFLLYPHGDQQTKAHLTFFLALTQISAVFCLFPLRPAALSVATFSTIPFLIHFAIVDNARMLPEALMLTLVAGGMVFILYKYNSTFSKLIRSRHILRQRQLETQKLSDENRQIAFTDPLSGLPNRRALLSRLENIAGRTSCEPGRLAMVFIDLDGFKVINDFHGHQFGDHLITEVGRTLSALHGEHSMLARMGGDEFALLIEEEYAGEAAQQFAAMALERLTQPITILDRQFQIGASIGIAIDAEGLTAPFELLRQADTAMYAVKANGKHGIQVFDKVLDEGKMWRHQIEQEIAAGLGRCEFDVVYQPIVDARTEAVVCVEALVRWPGRPGGPLTPDEFIGIAEGSGTIQALGMYVLERACRETRDVDGLNLSVNVSPTQFNNPDFCTHVQQILALTGFPPERLQLEITERHLIDYPERASLAIDTLRDLGVRFALDDFGTGFTSIAYLQSFGFSCVKIDRSLTMRLEHDPKAGFLISGLIQMARGLDVSVVVEGVENGGLAATLRATGCRQLQGYHFGRPGPLRNIVGEQRTKTARAAVA
ncbi:MAG TPA: EAL domain-containing protein [Hyphomonas sp.]|nr:EAL domain-containing protein [Hyphomonas sp.]HRK66488.1 EAL domain-containing protein [Hyphomonas sp.]